MDEADKNNSDIIQSMHKSQCKHHVKLEYLSHTLCTVFVTLIVKAGLENIISRIIIIP